MKIKKLKNKLNYIAIIFSGLVLVVLILFVALGVRNALFVAAAIPLSMLISFLILQALGVTLNFVVLFALILALGMLVDNAIVVTENISRFIEKGENNINAAIKGTNQIGWAIVSATATTGPLADARNEDPNHVQEPNHRAVGYPISRSDID